MAEKGLPAPTPKPGKTKIPVANQTTKRANISLEPRVIIKPIDSNQGQNALNPPNQPVYLPDQLPNIPNPPPPPPIPAYLPNPQNLSNQQNPLNPPNHPNQQNQPNQQNLPIQQNQPDQPDQQNLPNQPNQQDPPQNPQPNPPPIPPNQPNPMDQPNPPQPQQMNWSYFKPEFSVKAEDATSHLLKTNDWMDTYNFPEDIRVRRICLTLTGEARLWYESLKPIDMDCNALQTRFRQQYSKFGSSREQYFHIWRSFHYDENEDTIDSYILKVKEVASLFNYGEPEILELFKNTLPSKLYWILFPINNLREAIDTAKRVMNKEKLDKQLTGQTSNISPFMKLGDDTHSGQQRVLTPQDLVGISSMMYNMSLQQGKTWKPFKPQVYQRRGRDQRQGYNRNGSRNNSRQGQNFGQNRHGNDYRRNGYTQNFSRNNGRDRGRNFNRNYSSDRNRSRERRLSPRRYNNNRQNTNSRFRPRSRSRSNSRVRTNRDRIRCYRC